MIGAPPSGFQEYFFINNTSMRALKPGVEIQSSLKEGKLKEETPKTKETCQKDGKELLPSKKQATIFKKVKQKEEEPASPKYFLFIEGSPNQIGSLE